MINVILYSQRDPRWRDIKHGTSTRNIGQTGCTISALAALLCHAGYNETPATVNTKLTQNGGYANGNELIWTVVVRIWPKLTWRGRLTHYDDKLAKEWIAKGMMPLIRVNAAPIGGAPGGAHWVGALGEGMTYDPWALPGAADQKAPFSKWSPNGMALYEYTPVSNNGGTPPGNGSNMNQEAYKLLEETWKDAGIQQPSDTDRMKDLLKKIAEFVGKKWNGGYLESERVRMREVRQALGLADNASHSATLKAIEDLKKQPGTPGPAPVPEYQLTGVLKLIEK